MAPASVTCSETLVMQTVVLKVSITPATSDKAKHQLHAGKHADAF